MHTCSLSFPYTVPPSLAYRNNFLFKNRKPTGTKPPCPHALPDLYSTVTRLLAAVTICLLAAKEQRIALPFCWWPSIPRGRKHRLIWKISRLRTRQSQAPTLSAARLDQQLAWQGILIPHIFCQALKSRIPRRQRSALLSRWQAAHSSSWAIPHC